MAIVNRRITLAARAVGLPKVSDFHLVYSPLRSPAAGEVLVRSVFLSLDPYMRGQMSDGDWPGRPVAIGEVMAGAAAGFVVESEDARFCAGDAVEGMLGWQEYAVIAGRQLRKIDPRMAPISTALGVLGMPGLTAFFGLLDICDPQPGQTVVVSGAAGGIGMVAGQIARIRGCRVVGVARSGSHVSWLLEGLGYDGAFTYETAGDCETSLDELCPDGIDVYFDTVGGIITDAALRRINTHARICVCGQSSHYNVEVPELAPRWLGQLIARGASVQGFLASGYVERFPEGLEQLSKWLEQGKLKYREDVAQGIEAAPQAFIRMLQGKNQGKQLVQLSKL